MVSVICIDIRVICVLSNCMKHGKFIVLHGANNLGKSTQAKLLVEKMNQEGYQTEYLKYPIYDIMPSGKIINDYLRNNNPFNLSPREAQVIYALNRTQYQPTLEAKLSQGINIVAEDYTGTGLAWGIGAGIDANYLKLINSHLLKEDLTLFLDGERFTNSIEQNHQYETDEQLWQKVRQAHLKLGEELGWIKINANLPIAEIHGIIWETIKNSLNS